MENYTITALRYSQKQTPNVGVHLLAWDVPDSELIHINDHWLVFPEPEASLHYLLGILYAGIILGSLIGNGLVMWIFTTAKSLRTPSNMFIVNLAFCDFIMMCKMPLFVYHSFNRITMRHLVCQIFGFVGSMSGIGAGMTNACIAYDRYATISNPLEGKLTHTKAFVMILGVWLYTTPWAVLPFVEVWGRFVPEGFLTQCSFDYLTDTFDNKMFVAVIFTFSYVIPMSMIIYFYSQIVKHVVAHENALREQAKKMNVESLRSNQTMQKQSAEIRIAKVAIVICFLFVAAWTPYAIMAMIGAFGNKSLLTPGLTVIPALACKVISVIDPIVYALSHPRYRIELQKKLPWLAINESSSDDSKSTNSTVTSATAAETT